MAKEEKKTSEKQQKEEKKAGKKKKNSENETMKKEPVEKKQKKEEAEKHAEQNETVKKEREHKEKHAKKDKTMLRLKRLLKQKHLPTFRGRFGVKSIRKKSIEKWQKWRKPRGEDIQRNQEDGARPKSGYRTSKEIRFLHPSGYREVMVRNLKEVSGLKDCIVRIASGIGKKKRKIIIAEAKKNNLKIAN